MRRMVMVLSLMAVLVPLAAVAALAAEGKLIQCKTVPCYGSNGDDKILERMGDGKKDQIVPTGGDDLVLANKYTNDTDVVTGGGGFDKINVADGDKLDTANGGKGKDICIVDAKKEAGTGCAQVQVQPPRVGGGTGGETQMPQSKEECKDGGWMDFEDASGDQAYKNQGQCIKDFNLSAHEQ